jgi:hypothetical protein
VGRLEIVRPHETPMAPSGDHGGVPPPRPSRRAEARRQADPVAGTTTTTVRSMDQGVFQLDQAGAGWTISSGRRFAQAFQETPDLEAARRRSPTWVRFSR